MMYIDEKQEVLQILNNHKKEWNDLIDSSDNFYGSNIFNELVNHYVNIGEMPYSVLKGREGPMADEWLYERLEELGVLDKQATEVL